MKVYLASSFDLTTSVDFVARWLERKGHTIAVKWWSKDGFDLRDKKSNQTSDLFYRDDVCRQIFERDLRGVEESDALVIVAGGVPKKFNGANVEYGIAVASGKPCFSIGTLENSAMYYPIVRCTCMADLEAALKKVKYMGRRIDDENELDTLRQKAQAYDRIVKELEALKSER